MTVSIFDIFKIGVGPSSSHTVGPMRAGALFLDLLRDRNCLEDVQSISVELMGSLAATGKGHGTDTAVQLGLMGQTPETMDPELLQPLIEEIQRTRKLRLGGKHEVVFDPETDIIFHPKKVPAFHTNAMTITARGENHILYERRFYSVGGGFVVRADEDAPELPVIEKTVNDSVKFPHEYHSCVSLMALAKKENLSIAEIVMQNECAIRSEAEVNEGLDLIWNVMHAGIVRGMKKTEPLPGPFHISRRASRLAKELEKNADDPLVVLDWVNVYAMAVAEENAAAGRVVTAPTNGAAGVIPAVLQYYLKHVPGSDPNGIRTFLLTAGAIGILYKENASISGAEVGCQGEVGVACSMAAGALAAVLGGTIEQIENAAEIGMEHNLGLTCDPVAGQVQIPCIERNAIAATKAINAARMALRGDGSHYISLDQVIRTMLETGRDMQSKYKETSLGGLAVSIVEC